MSDIEKKFNDVLETVKFAGVMEGIFRHRGGDDLMVSCSCGQISQGDISLAFITNLLDHTQDGHTITLKKEA